MYKYRPIEDMKKGSQFAILAPVKRYGISVYVDSDPDVSGPDFIIDPADTEGLAIFREFAAKINEHYNKLKP
jgi:hypothetical protein